MSAIIWVHEDALSHDHPVFEAAGSDARAIFIWDAEDFQRRGHSLKKLVFIYECLMDMNVEIIEGNTASSLKSLAGDKIPIFYAQSFNPELMNLIELIRDEIACHMIKSKPLSDIEITADMTRFFRYWNKAKRSIMMPQ